MQVGQRLELKQTQQLVMTPQLQQAIKLLQMSSLDAADFIADALESNPMLKVEDGSAETAPETPDANHDKRTGAEGADGDIANGDPGRAEDAFDTGHENLYESAEATRGGLTGDSFSSSRIAEGGGGDHDGFEERLVGPVTLRDHLLPQIAVAPARPEERLLASLMVDELDDAGYLRAEPEALAERLGGGPALAASALALLQSCDPAGVGARDLAECLALQLKEQNRYDPAIAALLERLDDLAAGRLDALRLGCRVSREDLAEMIAEIRALNPRPGAAFSTSVAQTLIPDVFVRRNGIGGWTVEVNADALPKVLLDTAYAAELNARGEPATRSYLSDCRQNADWLIRALDQRAQTILKVATEIVRRQTMFFTEGVSGLAPITLRTIADEIGMHESTVSRVTANKHLACERGLFEMKFFFSQAIASTDGEDSVSAAAVRHQIKVLIEKEDSRKTLSDDKLVKLLKQNGVKIARRTVAKYREAMNIPSSARRKRLNAAALSS